MNAILTHAEYSNVAYLQRFGILYFIRNEDGTKVRGTWGVALSRLHKFLKNEWQVAEYFVRDVDSKTNEMSENRVFLSQIKKSYQVLDPVTMFPTFLEFENDYQNEEDYSQKEEPIS